MGSAISRPGPTRRRRSAGVVIACALTVVAATASTLAVRGADASPPPGSTPFGSGFGYTMMLPPGWHVTVASGEPAGGEDLFEGPNGASARVGGGPADPSHSVADRVAANREEMTADGTCQSDPAADTPSELGGQPAIAWTWRCEATSHAAVNTLYDGLRLQLRVNVPLEAEADAAPLLETLRSTFAFVSAPGSGVEPDLAALEGVLEGSYETPWHPVELEFAAIEAAGVERPGDPAWEAGMAAIDTVRHVIRFEDGQMTEYCAADGGPLEICWSAAYRLLDDHTIEAVEGPFRTTYAFTLRDGILTLDVLETWRDGEPAPAEMVAHTGIFETLPLTRIP